MRHCSKKISSISNGRMAEKSRTSKEEQRRKAEERAQKEKEEKKT